MIPVGELQCMMGRRALPSWCVLQVPLRPDRPGEQATATRLGLTWHGVMACGQLHAVLLALFGTGGCRQCNGGGSNDVLEQQERYSQRAAVSPTATN